LSTARSGEAERSNVVVEVALKPNNRRAAISFSSIAVALVRTVLAGLMASSLLVVLVVPWATASCADVARRLAPVTDASVSAEKTACKAGGADCSAAADCCSLLCGSGQCADPSPPPVILPTCPADPPAQGDPCSATGAICEFGTSSIASCDTVAMCESGRWQISAPDPNDPWCTQSLVACPPLFGPSPTGQSCSTLNAYCETPPGRCECAQNAPVLSWPTTWKCSSIPRPPCPFLRPRLGTACQAPLLCDYGACTIHGGNREVCLSIHGKAGAPYDGLWGLVSTDCSCPAAAPSVNSLCSNFGLTCEYGLSNVPVCDTVMTCEPAPASSQIPTFNGLWRPLALDGGFPCPSALSSACPDSSQAIEGTACSSPSLVCDYADKRCECAIGPAPASATAWRCTNPGVAGAGCGRRPRLGAPCPQNGVQCNYGACSVAGGVLEYCDGVWKAATVDCGADAGTALSAPDASPD
jgi:hypothetical protein